MAAGSTAERILNQEEIDSPAGFDVNSDQMQDKSGVRAIINSALVSYERLPMLEIVFDRLVRLMTTSLRNFTLRQCRSEPGFHHLDPLPGDYLNSIPLPAILAVFHAEELDNYGLFTVDSNLIYSIVDVLLGGRRGSSAMRIEGRPYTTIERTLVQRMVESDPGRHVLGIRAPGAGQFHPRPPGNQSPLCRHRPSRQCRDPGQAAHRHGRPRRAHRIAAALCHAGADPQIAAAAIHGREIRPRFPSGKAIWRRNCGRPRSISKRSWTNRPCR